VGEKIFRELKRDGLNRSAGNVGGRRNRHRNDSSSGKKPSLPKIYKKASKEAKPIPEDEVAIG